MNTTGKIRISVVLGTRPDTIKLAPLVLAARASAQIEVTVYYTGQHADMCHDVLELFGISPDIDFHVMRPRQSLTELTVAILEKTEIALTARRPDWLIVQGDTTGALAAALAAFYQNVPVAHVEAGLRTGNINAPRPEEMNRRVITTLSQLHFAPTKSNAENLQREGVDPARIVITGNTGIDAFKWLVRRLGEDQALATRAEEMLNAGGLSFLKGKKLPLVLVTAHRRESFGPGLVAICRAISTIARRFPDRQFVYPVHPNPQVREAVRLLESAALPNVHLIDPLPYLPFVLLMSRAELILTDSGGIQEEAPSIGKRVVVMRQVTERTELLETGMTRLAGTDEAAIASFSADALEGRWPASSNGTDVYGDGHAAERVIEAILAAPRD